MTKSLFRKLLIFWWILLAGLAIVMWTTEKYLPPELIHYLARLDVESPPLETTVSILGGLLALAVLVASIGLFFLKRRAREGFVLGNIVMILLTPFYEPSVVSVWAETVGSLHAILTGGLLFSLYLPPLKQLIETNSASDI